MVAKKEGHPLCFCSSLVQQIPDQQHANNLFNGRSAAKIYQARTEQVGLSDNSKHRCIDTPMQIDLIAVSITQHACIQKIDTWIKVTVELKVYFDPGAGRCLLN